MDYDLVLEFDWIYIYIWYIYDYTQQHSTTYFITVNEYNKFVPNTSEFIEINDFPLKLYELTNLCVDTFKHVYLR